ncbi:hypothetical protein ACO2Q8_16455 [Larkinella sp. VNQ87]|uniref:hypothetical protein n=1 Tax=Larkinella sp. VNQ87 TaxID=3400921 RepID=UPI003C089783
MNRLLEFAVDKTLWQANQIELADTIRLMLYQHHPAWFERLDYDDDRIFLEPAFFYFFSEKSFLPLPLEQLIYGYLPEADRPKRISCLTDPFGFTYLPNVGVLKTGVSAKRIDLELKGRHAICHAASDRVLDIMPIDYLKGSALALCDHLPFILYTENGKPQDFAESASSTKVSQRLSLERAATLLQNHAPFFWHLVEQSTRELAVFNSPMLRSMGAVSYLGTAFINTEGQPHDEVFFIDDLAHQIGHILFYSLTLKVDDYLTVPKTILLAELTGVSYDKREVYSAFHGLFTYTTILHCLQACLAAQVWSERHQLEAVARMGFYMAKFALDLSYMDDPRIFTPVGRRWYEAFREGFNHIDRFWKSAYQSFDYSSQPYIFNFQAFLKTNFQGAFV